MDTNNNIKNFFIKDKLGSGSYGCVYSAVDEQDDNYAIKQCKITDQGIPSILEPSIMTSIIHPCINNALDVYCSDHHIYILSLKAESDLARHLRHHPNTSIQVKLLWCYQLATAVACLHSQGIIHADIKAGNVLLTSEGMVKLTDFTLAIRKHFPDQKFNHSACTPTHRPLECIMGKSWDESLDLWSLGCTMFEIIYSKSPFPYQGTYSKEEEKENIYNNKQLKLRMKRRTANCIMHWDNICNGAAHKLYDLEFTEYAKELHLTTEINMLILALLSVDPKNRPSIRDVVNHKLFTEFRNTKYLEFDIISASKCLKKELSEYDIVEVEEIAEFLEKENQVDEYILKKAFKIYKRAYTLQGIPNDVKFKACVIIATKIIMGYVYKFDPLSLEIADAEKKISHYLSFRLH